MCSGADLAALVREACLACASEFLEKRKLEQAAVAAASGDTSEQQIDEEEEGERAAMATLRVCFEHFDVALGKVQPSVSAEVRVSLACSLARLHAAATAAAENAGSPLNHSTTSTGPGRTNSCTATALHSEMRCQMQTRDPTATQINKSSVVPSSPSSPS